jgi:hypothetical protein
VTSTERKLVKSRDKDSLKNVRISEEVPDVAVEVAHVRRDGGHFRQEAPHVTRGDDDVRQSER